MGAQAMSAVRIPALHPLTSAIVVAVAVRGLYFLIFSAGSDEPLLLGGGDGTEYWALGEHLTREFSFDAPMFLYRPPGYPLLIALQMLATPGNSEWVPIVVNALLSVAIVPLTYVLAKSLGLSRNIGLIAAFIMAVEPTTSIWAVTPTAEPLEAVFVVAAIASVAAAVQHPAHAVRYAALGGVAIALALVVKPAAIGMAAILAALLVLGLWRAVGTRSLAAGGLVVGLTLVPYVAWTQSNERSFGVASYSSLGNYQLYFVRGTSVLRRVSGKPPRVIEQQLADQLSRELGARPSRSRDFYYYRRTTDKRTIAEMGQLARKIFLDHPVWFVAMYPVSAAKLFFVPGSTFPVALYAALQAVLYLAALVGLRRLWRSGNRLAVWTVVGVVGYVAVVTTTGHGSPNARYLVPVIPLIAIAAAAALVPRPNRPPSR